MPPMSPASMLDPVAEDRSTLVEHAELVAAPERPPAGVHAPARAALVRDASPFDLARLRAVRGYPLVTVVVPTMPGARIAPADRAALHAMLASARARLGAELDGPALQHMTETLERLASEAVEQPVGRGLVLLVGGGVEECYRLPISPSARVVVDPTFATRDLALALARESLHRVCVIGNQGARLFMAVGNRLDEVVDGEWPMREPLGSDDRRGHRHEAERRQRDGRRVDAFLRRVDTALAHQADGNDVPLVVVAAAPLASRFARSATVRIDATVTGSHLGSTRGRIAAVVEPARREIVDRQRGEARRALDDAADRSRAVFGLADVWHAARRRTVAHLVVDATYAQPVRIVDDRPVPVRDREHPDVLDDAVDELIEMVSAAGGETTFVEPSDLPVARVAAIVRTR